MVLRPQPTRKHLRAKTDAQDGYICRSTLGHQRAQAGQVGVGVIIQRGLLTAKADQCIKAARFGQNTIAKRAINIHQRAHFVQRNPHLPVMGDLGIFHNRHPHRPPFRKTPPNTLAICHAK